MIVIACPGQGSQTPGFLQEWCEDPSAREFLSSASELIGVDLIAHGTTSDADTIRDTSIAQPLIVAASLLAWRALQREASFDNAAVAGHSVGEFAAAAVAGVLSPEDALTLVAARGKAMAHAAAQTDTVMAAVVGGREADVLAAIAAHGLTPANRNGGGQIVAAGLVAGINALAEDPPRGTRVIKLQVAGAFHTDFMQPAVSTVQDVAAGIAVENPTRTLWTNADGSTVSNGQTFLDLMVSQISNPVRWDLCMEAMSNAGISGFIELTPAGALTGIAKRALKGVPSVAIKSPDDIAAAVDLLHATSKG